MIAVVLSVCFASGLPGSAMRQHATGVSSDRHSASGHSIHYEDQKLAAFAVPEAEAVGFASGKNASLVGA
eukprot:2628943-Prymnesium_polylepis.1